MSGSTIGGFAGAAIGFMFGGPAGAQWGFMIGSAVGGYVDPPKIEGPRLTDAQTQTSNEGVPRPIVYGTAAVAGNITQCGPLVEHKKKERQGKGGPEVTSYTYTRTVAIRICEAAPLGGEMKLRRVWMDDKLVYDVSGSGLFDADSAKFASILTFYSGAEDQLPDPSLEALPAENGGGVGNVPSYRGTCYAVLTDLDCTDRQGAVPQFRWEVSSNAIEQTTSGIASLNPDDPDLLFWYPLDDASRNGSAREVVNSYDGTYSDTAGVSIGPPLRAGSAGSLKMASRADYMVCDLSSYAAALNFKDRPEWTLAAYALQQDADLGGAHHKIVGVNWGSPSSGDSAWRFYFQKDDSIPVGSYDNGSGPGGLTITIKGDSELFQHVVRLVMTYSETTGKLSLYENGKLVKQQDITNAPTSNGRYIAVGGAFFPDSYGFIGCVSDLQGWKRAFSAGEISEDALMSDTTYTVDGNGIFVKSDGTVLVNAVTVVTPGAILLSNIVADLCDRAGVASDQVDVSALATKEVRGYPIARQTSAAEAIRPLQDVFDFDMPEWGNSGDDTTKLRAVLRGGAIKVTVTDDDLVDNDEDDDGTRAQQVEFPRKVTLTFADPDANYEPASQTAERTTENVRALGEQQISTSVVLSRDEAAVIVDKLLKRLWEEANGRISRELPEEFSQYTPSDPVSYLGKRWRIEKAERADGTTRWDMVRDRASNTTSTATGSPAQTPTSPTSAVRGPTIFVAMNLPSLRSADNVPGMYLAAQGLLPGWAGADIYLSVDGGVSEQKVMTIVDPAVIGELATDCDADGADSMGLIEVQVLPGGELDSITEAQMDARQNGFALITDDVAEVGQFQAATESSTEGLYDLTNVLRGELGTTAAAHSAGDRFVLLDGNVRFLPLDAALGGQTLIFRAVSIGTAPANNPTTSVVFDPPVFIIDGGGA